MLFHKLPLIVNLTKKLQVKCKSKFAILIFKRTKARSEGLQLTCYRASIVMALFQLLIGLQPAVAAELCSEFLIKEFQPTALEFLLSHKATAPKQLQDLLTEHSVLPVFLTFSYENKSIELVGHLEITDFTADKKLYLLTDKIGNTHLIDFQSLQPYVYILDSIYDPAVNFVEPTEKPLLALTNDDVFCAACEITSLTQKLPQYEQFKEIFEDQIEKASQQKRQQFYDNLGNVWAKLHGLSWVLYGVTGTLRDIFHINNTFTLHQDNFTLGISFLGIMHSVAQNFSPHTPRWNLYGSMAITGFANYLLEMSSSPLNILMQRQPLTDWPDMVSGAAGIATFYVSTIIAEKYFAYKLQKLCSQAKFN